MTAVRASVNIKPFVPNQIFLAHEFFLKGVPQQIQLLSQI